MTDFFRCIHCDQLYPRERASMPPLANTWDNPLPIGVCDQPDCVETHDIYRAKKPGLPKHWRDQPHAYWGTCLDCRGAVWVVRPGRWQGSWSWVCAKCGMRWPSTPPADEVLKE